MLRIFEIGSAPCALLYTDSFAAAGSRIIAGRDKLQIVQPVAPVHQLAGTDRLSMLLNLRPVNIPFSPRIIPLGIIDLPYLTFHSW